MQAVATSRKPSADTYRKVFDSRKRRVRGLWLRNSRYFANLTVSDDLGRKSTRMVPLAGSTLEAAKADYARLQTERADDRLRPVGLSPIFADYVNVHTQLLEVSGKRASSVQKEIAYLKQWSKKIGNLRLNKIRGLHLNHALMEFSREGYAARSVNLHLMAIRGLFKAALRDAHVKPPLPFEGLTWKRVDQKARCLYTAQEIDQLCELALSVSKNGRQFVDYLRFMQYTGARRSEALRVRWDDVDFKRGHVVIAPEGDSKNRQPRHLDLNPKLEAHLKQMSTRRQPDSKFLFPSPQRGDKDASTKTFMESLRLTRGAEGCVCQDCQHVTVGADAKCCSQCRSERVTKLDKLLPVKLQRFTFHDLRHHFVSYAVMSGIDFMTIAKWVGHKDGGVLIGKVYGHLADSHRKSQAARMNFGSPNIPLPVRSGAIQSSQSAAPANNTP